MILSTVGGGDVCGQTYRYEAELGTIRNFVFAVPARATRAPAMSRASTPPAAPTTSKLQVDIPDGLYEMWVGYRSLFGEKGYTYQSIA